MLVGVLGPEGTYSEMAALAMGFREDALCYFTAVEDVASDLIGRRLDCGVIPLENSIEGSVGTTLDVLLTMPLQIAREIISHTPLSCGPRGRRHSSGVLSLASNRSVQRVFARVWAASGRGEQYVTGRAHGERGSTRGSDCLISRCGTLPPADR